MGEWGNAAEGAWLRGAVVSRCKASSALSRGAATGPEVPVGSWLSDRSWTQSVFAQLLAKSMWLCVLWQDEKERGQQQDQALAGEESSDPFPCGACTWTDPRGDAALQGWDGSVAARKEHPGCTLVRPPLHVSKGLNSPEHWWA